MHPWPNFDLITITDALLKVYYYTGFIILMRPNVSILVFQEITLVIWRVHHDRASKSCDRSVKGRTEEVESVRTACRKELETHAAEVNIETAGLKQVRLKKKASYIYRSCSVCTASANSFTTLGVIINIRTNSPRTQATIWVIIFDPDTAVKGFTFPSSDDLYFGAFTQWQLP